MPDGLAEQQRLTVAPLLGPSRLSALLPVTVETECDEFACRTCADEGVVRVGSGHNDREVPCGDCQEVIEDDLGRPLYTVPALSL